MSKIIVAGIGPGSPQDITPAVKDAVAQSTVVVGYKYYFRFIQDYLKPGTQCIDTGMKKERERAEHAFRLAAEGHNVCVISSGDAGIYGMAPLIYEMNRQQGLDIEIECLPGISAFQKAASILGAPIGHDLCIISLSDLMTPWSLIERRIRAAATGDFVTAIYNPRSHGRYWQLQRLKEIFMSERSGQTVVGFVRQAGRPEQQHVITTLEEFDPNQVDMFTVVLVGNSQTYMWNGRMITPRGYYLEDKDSGNLLPVGRDIMKQSFLTIMSELKCKDIPMYRLWPLLHAIHTSADFGMEEILLIDKNATSRLYEQFAEGSLRHIVTDVSMVASGIRKGALDRLGIEVHCYINDPRTLEMAKKNGITRSQACMRLAAQEYPNALYAIGNAPTALLELCELTRCGQMHPASIIAAPVGFVHVCESKHAVKTLTSIPKFIVEGRKGGSNIAATLVNSILTFDDAALFKPGRDV